MKRILSVLLSLCLLLSLVSISATAVAEDDWITLRFQCYDRQTAGLDLENCAQLKYIQENFGDPNHIKVEIVPIPRWTAEEVLNRQLGGQTAPDLCYMYDTALVQSFVDMEGLLPLDDLLAKYGQNLVKFLGESVLAFGQTDGVQYYIPARRIGVERNGAVVRKDWLDKLGMEVPTTVDELVKYFYAAKEANLGGEQTIPMVIKTVPEAPLFNQELLILSYLDFDQITPEMWWTQYSFQLPGAKDAFRLLNQLYNDGIINETFAIDNGDIRDQALNQGYAGFYCEAPTQVYGIGSGYQFEMEQNVEGALYVPAQCFQNKDGHYYHEVYDANGQCIFIPAWVSEDVAAAAIKLLDWMSVLENRFYLQHGVLGIHYKTLSPEGLPLDRVGSADIPDEWKFSGDLMCFSNGTSFDDPELDALYRSISNPKYQEQISQALLYANVDTYTPPTFTCVIQSEIDYGTMVKTKILELQANAVTCKPEEFDAVYDQFAQAVLDVGGAEIIAEKLEAFQAGKIRGIFPGDL